MYESQWKLKHYNLTPPGLKLGTFLVGGDHCTAMQHINIININMHKQIHIKFRHGIQFVAHTSSIFSAAYAPYLYPGYRGSGTILPVGTGDKIGLTENSP